MFSNNDILNELYSISPALIPLQKLNVFTVPENYFENFYSSVLIRPELAESEISVLPVEALNLMDVPTGYFDNLAENILAKIKAAQPQTTLEELNEISPALAATGNDNVFTVPGRYFSDLPEIILNRMKPAKVISMKPRSSFARYAAAAVITGVLGLSLFTIFNKKSTPENPVLTASVIADANNIIRTNSFDKVLETVSDEDIVGYLENNGQDVKAALVAAATDTKELPSADDYITDDNTLNKFLDGLNLNDYSN
jgi:hypothetical protein